MGEEVKERDAVVIDNGACAIKAGFSGDEVPNTVVPCMVGRARYDSEKILETVSTSKTDTYIGEEAQARRGILSLQYPIERGVVKNWDDMLSLWEHVYHLLGADPLLHPVQITESPLSSTRNSEKMIEVLFEKVGVPAVNVSMDALLALYASGRTTGLVLTSGESNSNAIPIYEGHLIKHAMQRIELGGRDLTSYLHTLLQERYRTLSHTTAELDIVRDMKERLCYCAPDFGKELLSSKDSSTLHQTYELPDGTKLSIGNERFRCPEVLFQPFLIGLECCGVHGLTEKSVLSSPIDVRKVLFQNIVLAGGTTTVRGFVPRFKEELSKKSKSKPKVKVIAPDERKHSVWIGGSILSSLRNFWAMWITKQEFEESGPKVVHRKCIFPRFQ